MSEKINPLSHLICLKPPKWFKESGWIQHTPFALYLVDLLKPKTIVELGTYAGTSYCSFCQAVNELKIDTQCYAIDTWEGDPHAGNYGPKIFKDLKKHHDPLYGDFSTLLKKDFDNALNDFADGSIDLLHIDGYHTFDAVSHDFHSWLPKISHSGIILFHDTNVYQDSFGVWKFWQSIRKEYPSFEFFHGSGLGILVTGDSVPSGILKITTLTGISRKLFVIFFLVLGKIVDLYSKLARFSVLLRMSTSHRA